jgi:hypothetical protein
MPYSLVRRRHDAFRRHVAQNANVLTNCQAAGLDSAEHGGKLDRLGLASACVHSALATIRPPAPGPARHLHESLESGAPSSRYVSSWKSSSVLISAMSHLLLSPNSTSLPSATTSNPGTLALLRRALEEAWEALSVDTADAPGEVLFSVTSSPDRAPAPALGGQRRPARRPGARRHGRALRRTGDAPRRP